VARLLICLLPWSMWRWTRRLNHEPARAIRCGSHTDSISSSDAPFLEEIFELLSKLDVSIPRLGRSIVAS
jgi:hypothetical protein